MQFHLKPKIFGVALDASDDPFSIQLKLASLNAMESLIADMYIDPFDVVLSRLHDFSERFETVGKFSVPSWLTPRPQLSDMSMIKAENFDKYVTNGGIGDLCNEIKNFINKKVLPGLPVMLGVDHSTTGAVITAISEERGPENLSIIVLDQHFDGLPLSLRLEQRFLDKFGQLGSGAGPLSDIAEEDAYCCGNFWKYLIDDGVILPENLLFIGVADYPGIDTPPGWERYQENYLGFESRGCRFFPLSEFQGRYSGNLGKFIEEGLNTQDLYVSLDLDVGAYECVHAARYMDRPGLGKEALLETARIIRNLCDTGKTRLVGMDIMEFNMHFLGIRIGPDKKDGTLAVALDFAKELLFD